MMMNIYLQRECEYRKRGNGETLYVACIMLEGTKRCHLLSTFPSFISTSVSSPHSCCTMSAKPTRPQLFRF